jgi:ABC-type transport system substrate-binding protein
MKTIDRDSFIIGASNTDRFAKEGLPVQEFWEAGLGAGTWTGWYLDPKDEKAFGPNAKNYKFDLAESKKLLEAAGHRGQLDVSMVYAAPSPTSFPASFYKRAEIFMGMVENSRVFKMKRDLITYQDWNTEKVRFSKGQFTGATWGPDTATGDPAANIFFLYNSKGGYFQGGDAKMDDLTAKARAEFDDKKRQELVHEAQRYNGEKFWNNKIGTAGGFGVFWPILRNYQVYRGGTNWSDIRVYLDPSQPPKKS